MNKTLSEIQKELKVWTFYNFGEQETIIPIMGMIEELGELTHAHLKELQNIRKSDFLADKKDAIADITIYLLNYFNCIHRDINIIKNVIYCEHEEADNEFYILNLSHKIGILSDTEINNNTIVIDIKFTSYILFTLREYANNINLDLITIVNEVWEQVKLRDWKQYPLNGKTE